MRIKGEKSMLIIRRCNLINMADIYEETRDIAIKDGKIIEIQENIDAEKYDNVEIIDANNDIVTPGIVEPHCQLGVKEQIYRFEGDDSNETTDPILPQIRAIDAINPADEGIQTARESGVTTVVSGPGESNLIGGTFAAFKTFGKTIDDMIIEDEIAFKVTLGNAPKDAYGSKDIMPKTRMASAAMIREAFLKTKEYHRQFNSTKAPKFDMKLHSLMRIFDGMLVKFAAHQAYDIITAIRLGEEFELNYTVDKCSEAYLIGAELKKFNSRFVVGPAYGGKREHEIKNRDTIVAGIMEENNLDFCISTGHPAVDLSMGMVQATMMHKKGLSKEAALKAMTINAAKMVGLNDRIGSIEVDKDADIVIWDGEPLDYYSSPRKVFIDGNLVYSR